MDWKKIARKLLFPHILVMLLLIIVSIIALVAVFIKRWEAAAVGYIVYVLSFYTLCVVSIFLVKVLPGRYRSIRQKVYETSFGNRYMTDKAFRVKVSLYISLGDQSAVRCAAGCAVASFSELVVRRSGGLLRHFVCDAVFAAAVCSCE